MKKTHGFLLAAGLLLASAFTLSCSSDDPDDNSGGGIVNLSEYLQADRQVYLREGDGDDATKRYDGSGSVVYMYIYSIGERFQVGTIRNGGILKLDSLPNMSGYIESFYAFSGRCKDFDPATHKEYSSCNGIPSVSPSNLLFLEDVEFHVDIPDCYLNLRTVKSGKWSNGADLIYASQPGSITGTEKYTYREDNGGGTRERKYEYSFKEGWNIVFQTSENRNNTRYYTHTSDIPAGTTLEWGLECYID